MIPQFMVDLAEGALKQTPKAIGQFGWMCIGIGVAAGSIVTGIVLLIIYLFKQIFM